MHNDHQAGSRRWPPTRIARWGLSEVFAWTGHSAASWAVDGVALLGVGTYLLVRRAATREATAIDHA